MSHKPQAEEVWAPALKKANVFNVAASMKYLNVHRCGGGPRDASFLLYFTLLASRLRLKHHGALPLAVAVGGRCPAITVSLAGGCCSRSAGAFRAVAVLVSLTVLFHLSMFLT